MCDTRNFKCDSIEVAEDALYNMHRRMRRYYFQIDGYFANTDSKAAALPMIFFIFTFFIVLFMRDFQIYYLYSVTFIINICAHLIYKNKI